MFRLVIILISNFIKFLDSIVTPLILVGARIFLAIPVFGIAIKKLMNYGAEVDLLKGFYFISPHIIFITMFILVLIYSISLIAGLGTRICALILAGFTFYDELMKYGIAKLLAFSDHMEILTFVSISVLVLFGPGVYSVDFLVERRWVNSNDLRY